MVPVTPRATSEDLLRQQAFTPQRDQSRSVEVPWMDGPQPHNATHLLCGLTLAFSRRRGSERRGNRQCSLRRSAPRRCWAIARFEYGADALNVSRSFRGSLATKAIPVLVRPQQEFKDPGHPKM
jgi:hypothetical protein